MAEREGVGESWSIGKRGMESQLGSGKDSGVRLDLLTFDYKEARKAGISLTTEDTEGDPEVRGQKAEVRKTLRDVQKAPVKTGGVQWMKESYDEGIASHIGPESCGGASNGAAEALTGERAGRV